MRKQRATQKEQPTVKLICLTCRAVHDAQPGDGQVHRECPECDSSDLDVAEYGIDIEDDLGRERWHRKY